MVIHSLREIHIKSLGKNYYIYKQENRWYTYRFIGMK